MRNKFSKGIFFLLLSLLFLLISFSPKISGGAIGVNTDISLTFIVSAVFFILSILIFAGRQTLDAIVIPTGTLDADILRTETAEKEKDQLKSGGYFMISGYYPHGNLKGMQKSQDYRIYKHLREKGIIPAEIRVEGQAHDTLENILYSLKKIKQMAEKEGRTGTLDVGIATYHGHFERFKDFYRKAVKKGLIGKTDFRLHEIPTLETEEDRKYESSLPRKLMHLVKLETMGRYQGKKGEIKHAEQGPLIRLVNKTRDLLR
jgi:hypothetical protein